MNEEQQPQRPPQAGHFMPNRPDQPTTTPKPYKPASGSVKIWQLVIGVLVALLVGVLAGFGGMYMYATPVINAARQSASDWKKKYDFQVKLNEALIQEPDSDSTENEGDTGNDDPIPSEPALKILERKTIDYYGTPGAAYVVQNTTGQTLYNVMLTVAELDAAGVVHQGQTLHLGGRLEAGQTGSLEGMPSADNIVAFKAEYLSYGNTADDYGFDNEIQLADEPILKIR